MSSNKIYTSIGLEETLLKCLDEEAAMTNRSRSNLLAMILRAHYKLEEGSTKGEHQHGHKA